ncbi:MAG TPA: bifunctional oligoribonuclease/PAP phosphatase NrnA [Vicinamibacterales bacterium]
MDILRRIRDEILARQRFLLTSHARPDGDSIGSQLALAAALRHLGKDVRIVNRDAPPASFASLPGIEAIELADRTDAEADALIVLECSDLSRPGVAGLEHYFTINVDHHPGNAMYGAVNWFDGSAAACGEQVADIVDALGVPWSLEIATHIYLAILTDTGSFRHSHITARTFEICRRTAEAGVDPAAMARLVFEQSSLGKLRLIGAVLDRMTVAADGRLAILWLDPELLQKTGAAAEDTDGLINMPLMASAIRSVALIRREGDGQVRVSLRSKGAIDVRKVAATFGGGGHVNAAGFTVVGESEPAVRSRLIDRLTEAIDAAEADAQPAGPAV